MSGCSSLSQCGALPVLAGFYPAASCAGPYPVCPAGLNRRACTADPGAASAGPWVEVGYVYCTEAAPRTTYLTKSCASSQESHCTGCRATGESMDYAYDGTDRTADSGTDASAVHVLLRPNHEASLPQHLQRAASAFDRKTTYTNHGIGYGPFTGPRCGAARFSLPMTPTGAHHGVLHATGCKCNRCNSDVMYHPRTTITSPTRTRHYRLLARECGDGSRRLSYAVTPALNGQPMAGDGSVETPPLILPLGAGAGLHPLEDKHRRAYVELLTGDQVYLPGEPYSFHVHLYADDADGGVYRANHSVFRGWGPVSRLRGKQNVYRSGLRNLSSHPDATAATYPR